jgi:hypothetical protein
MKYNCRIGNMASYFTIRRTLVGLSDQETATTAAHGKDPNTAGFLFLENCQNQHKQWDLHIGRESVVNVGMSGHYFEVLERRRRCIQSYR